MSKILFIGNQLSPLARERFKILDALALGECFFFDKSTSEIYDSNLKSLNVSNLNKQGVFYNLIGIILVLFNFNRKFDIIHYHGASNVFLTFLVLIYRNIIVTVQGSDVNDGYRLPYKIFTSFLLNKASLVTVKSKNMEDRVKLISKNAETLMLNWGVDIYNFPEENSVKIKDKVIILSPRTAKKLYNIDVIFSAIRSLKSKRNDIYFIFVSLHPPTDGMLDLDIADEVYIGLDNKAIQYLMSRSDIVVSIPSNDGFSTSVMEALSQGALPVISDLAAYKGYFDSPELSRKFKLSNHLKFSEFLEETLENIEVIRSYRDLRKKYALEEFSRDAQLNIIRKAYERYLNKNN